MQFQWLMVSLVRLSVFALVLLIGGHVKAGSVVLDIYSDPGINPNRSYINQDYNEHIDPFTGSLQQHYVDLRIPGNGGFDLKVVRSYNSGLVNSLNPTTYNSLLGVGWTLHFGRILNFSLQVCTSATTDSDENPVLELPDGSQQILFFNSGSFITTQRWKAVCDLTSGGQSLTVYSPEGTRYDMKQITQERYGYSWMTTKITDKNGNYATIQYAGTALQEISNITTNDGRSISFTYADSGTPLRRITSITGAGQTYRYGYELVPNTANAYQLKSVTRPDGLVWQYDYYSFLNDKPGGYLMSKATYPQGGTLSYEYGFEYFYRMTAPFYKSTVVIQKTKKNKFQSYGSIWRFSYKPSNGLDQYDETTVTLPSGTVETYRHISPSSVRAGSVWSIGLLVFKSIGSVQTENYTWAKQKISSQTYRRLGAGTAWIDLNEINTPLLQEKTTVRDGATYKTTYSDFDAYGNPKQIVESGTSGGNRSTALTYYINTDKWIVKQVGSEVHSGGSITRDFDSNGNIKLINRDGVITRHDYDSQGNVISATYPRGLTHTEASSNSCTTQK